MAVQWTPDLAVGVDEIDRQHQELFRRVDQLLGAMSRGKGREEISPVIKFLGDYVVTHFGSEEAEMERRNYPDRASHKAAHAQFVAEFGKVRSEIEAKGATVSSTIRIQRWMTDWLVNHISKVDKKLGLFLGH